MPSPVQPRHEPCPSVSDCRIHLGVRHIRRDTSLGLGLVGVGVPRPVPLRGAEGCSAFLSSGSSSSCKPNAYLRCFHRSWAALHGWAQTRRLHKQSQNSFLFFFLIYFLNYSLVENASCLPDRERSGRGKNVQPQSPAAPLALRHVRGEEFSWPGHRAPALPP